MKHQVFRQPLVWLFITVHVVTICGCTTTNAITLPGNETPAGSGFIIATVTLKDGEIIEFDNDGGWYTDKTKNGKSYRFIVGTTDGKKVEIDPEGVLEVTFAQEEANGSVSFIAGLLIGMVAGAGILLLILLSEM